MSAKQLEVWRQRGLLDGNVQHSLGRGRGSVSRLPDGAKDMVLWLARHARRGGRPQDLALLAFGDGLPVPEGTVRAAFRSAIDRLLLTPERASAGADYDDPHEQTAVIADLVADRARHGTVVPARIRRIDERLAKAGWSVPPDAIARLDRGSSSPQPMTARDVTVSAVTTVRLGADGLSDQELGDLARAFLPADAVSPLASMIEHAAEGPAGSVLDMAGVIPAGDVRDHARVLVTSSPLDVLRVAWRAADEKRAWAEGLCAAVEADLEAQCPGDATVAWLLGSSLVARTFLVTALRQRRRTPTDQAQAAVGLLLIRDMLHRLREQIPSGSWDLLDQPTVVPEFFRPLLNS